MRTIKYFFPAFIALLLSACSSNDLQEEPNALRLSVPVQLVMSNSIYNATRATGDPGIDDELQPPVNLYLFAWVQTTASRYELYYTAKTGLTAADWTYSLGNDSEDQDSRYKLNTNVELPFQSSISSAKDGDMVGRVFAIATTRALTDGQLQSIAAYYSAALTSSTSIVSDRSPDPIFQNATASFEGWSSDDLRDLYSNPVADDTKDAYGAGNGQIVYDSSADGKARCGTIRLYHCAAKIDFTWEMDASLRATKSVHSIVIHGLPTSCMLFAPTYNPDDYYTEVTINTDMDTKWIGREYRYVLQPAIGGINYSVYFNNQESDPTNKLFSPVTINRVYTGWYRIVARIAPTS